MDDNNRPGNGFNFFGANDTPGSFRPEKLPKAADTVKKTPTDFEDMSSRSARTVNIGAINESDNKPVNETRPAKKKFVVSFDDSEDLLSSDSAASSKGVTRGGVYFTGRQKTHNAAPRSQSAQNRENENDLQLGNSSQPAAVMISGGRRERTARAAVPQKSNQPKKPSSGNSGITFGKFFTSFVAVVVVCSLVISLIGISCINDVLAINRKDDSIVVTIPNDADASDIIDILADNKLIHQPVFCKLFYRLKNAIFNKPDDVGFISAFMSGQIDEEPVFLSGVYYLDANMGLEGYLNKFQREQVAEKTINVFFPEGWSIYQMFDKLDNFGVCKKDELLAALEGADYDFPFVKEVPDSEQRVFQLEGYMFPDTYEFYETCDANTIIRKMLGNFESKWTEEYANRAKELGMTMDEVIILASIIQREAANAEQMGVVSSVLHNRLKNSVSFPTLGCDSTLSYIEKNVVENVQSNKAQVYMVSYDTYSIKGLPAGPICNPGIDAIEAALFPDDTDYLYFCHDNSGAIYLAYTNEEHDRNLLEVLRKNNG